MHEVQRHVSTTAVIFVLQIILVFILVLANENTIRGQHNHDTGHIMLHYEFCESLSLAFGVTGVRLAIKTPAVPLHLTTREKLFTVHIRVHL